MHARRLEHGGDIDAVRVRWKSVRANPAGEVRRRDERHDMPARTKGYRERQHRLDVAARAVRSQKDFHRRVRYAGSPRLKRALPGSPDFERDVLVGQRPATLTA